MLFSLIDIINNINDIINYMYSNSLARQLTC